MVMSRRPGNTGRSRGIPPKEIDWEKVDQMLIAGCIGTQIAATLGIHPDTLYTRCEKEKGVNFSAYYQEKRSVGDGYIHQAQYHKALKEKNTTMLIWLGKQRCGQKDEEKKTEFTQDQLEQFAAIMKFLDKNQDSALNKAESNNNSEEKS